jgi:Na+/melibiose symporter-like transporter
VLTLTSPEKRTNPTNSKDPSTGKMIMFSMGYFFNGFLIVAFGSFVWHYYEIELGLKAVVSLWPLYLWIVNVIYTVFSMVINPIIGFLSDKPRKWTKKWGFHTPWIIIGGIPTAILFFLIFIPPHNIGIESVFPILLYFLFTVFLYDVFNSLFQTHSFGAFPAHFRGDATRRKAGMITQILIFVANFFGTMIWSLTISPGKPATFTFAAFISLILLGSSLAIFIPGSKETSEIKNRFIIGYETAEKKSFLWTMKMAIKQKNFMLALLTYIFFMVALGLTSMNTVNFIDDVLKKEQNIRMFGSLFMLITSVATMPIWIRVARKIGHSNTYALGMVCFGFSLLSYSFVSNLIGYYIVNSLNGISVAMYTVVLSPVLADCYDEFAVKTKKHLESTLIGIRNLFLRVSIMIQTFIVAIVHLITAYDSNNPSREALFGLRLIQGVIPFFFCVIAAIVFFVWFDLKGKKKEEIMQQLKDMGL